MALVLAGGQFVQLENHIIASQLLTKSRLAHSTFYPRIGGAFWDVLLISNRVDTNLREMGSHIVESCMHPAILPCLRPSLKGRECVGVFLGTSGTSWRTS